MKKYQTIYADPPWKYGKWGKPSNKLFKRYNEEFDLPYPSMTIDEIKNLKVAELAEDNCQLFLWVTSKYLPFVFEIVKEWGFTYSQVVVWCKTPRGLGQGGLFTPTTEFLIVARKGKMPKVRRIDTTWFNWKRTNIHSKKPPEAYDLIEKVSNAPYLELFARNKRDGWDVWGNEVESDIELNHKQL